MARRTWIKNRDGRLVRARDRYRKTWYGKLNRQEHQHYGSRDCEECGVLQGMPAGVYHYRWNTNMYCLDCRELRRALWFNPDPRYFVRRFSRRTAPRWYRHQLEQEFRAEVRDLMHHERYDDLPATRRKDAAWLYW